jgi:hypothetical protein
VSVFCHADAVITQAIERLVRTLWSSAALELARNPRGLLPRRRLSSRLPRKPRWVPLGRRREETLDGRVALAAVDRKRSGSEALRSMRSVTPHHLPWEANHPRPRPFDAELAIERLVGTPPGRRPPSPPCCSLEGRMSKHAPRRRRRVPTGLRSTGLIPWTSSRRAWSTFRSRGNEFSCQGSEGWSATRPGRRLAQSSPLCQFILIEGISGGQKTP